MHVDGPGVAEPVVPPHAVEDLLPREREAGPLGEEAEEVELLGRELDRLVGDQDLPATAVDGRGPGLHDLGRTGAVDPAQHRLHPRHQLGGGERLGEVVVTAELESEHAVDFAVACGEEDHGDLRRLAQPPAHFEAVDVRESDVEHDESWPVGAHRFKSGLAGCGLQHPEPVTGQVQVDQVGDVGLVVDHHDRASFHGRNRRTSPARCV